MTIEKQKITREVDKDGFIIYRNEKGDLHRDDGPAVEHASGTKKWYHNSQIHREDGPAIEFADGTKTWCRYGDLHREDGPAVERTDGTVEYWLNGNPWPEGPRVIAERKAQEEREKKEKELQESLAHMRGVFNGAIPVDAKPISRLKVKPKSKPPQL